MFLTRESVLDTNFISLWGKQNQKIVMFDPSVFSFLRDNDSETRQSRLLELSAVYFLDFQPLSVS